MDFQFWFYLIIAVIYILSRALKKAEPAQQEKTTDRKPQGSQQGRPAPDRPKQLTFEELLKQIQEAKEQKPVQRPMPAPVLEEKPLPKYVDYDDDIKDEAEDLEDVDYDYKKKDKIYDVYEAAKKAAFYRPSLEETMDVRNTDMKFEKFKVFEQKKQHNLADIYLKDLRDPQSLKRAVVLGEILNRKF